MCPGHWPLWKVTKRPVEDHPSLTRPAPDSGGATLAATLLAESRILPILDGFDEIAADLRALLWPPPTCSPPLP